MIGTYEEAQERSKAVAEEIFDIINGADYELLVALQVKLQREHPTLQQSFFAILQKLIIAHSKREYTDMRNEASVEWAKKVADLTEGFSGFPYV